MPASQASGPTTTPRSRGEPRTGTAGSTGHTDPAVLAEYAALVEDEKRAAEARLDAIEAAGFEVPSIDQSDPDT